MSNPSDKPVQRMHLWAAPCTATDAAARTWEAAVAARDHQSALAALAEQAQRALGVEAVSVGDAEQIDDRSVQVYNMQGRERIRTAQQAQDARRQHDEELREIQNDPELFDYEKDLASDRLREQTLEWEPWDDHVWARSEAEAMRIATAGATPDEREVELTDVEPAETYNSRLQRLQAMARRGVESSSSAGIPDQQDRLVNEVQSIKQLDERIARLPVHALDRLDQITAELQDLNERQVQPPAEGPEHFRRAVAEMNHERVAKLNATRARTAEELKERTGRDPDELSRMREAFTDQRRSAHQDVGQLHHSIAKQVAANPPAWVLNQVGAAPLDNAKQTAWTTAVRAVVTAQLHVDPTTALDIGPASDPTPHPRQRPHANRALQALTQLAGGGRER